jgi:hypothetical protein
MTLEDFDGLSARDRANRCRWSAQRPPIRNLYAFDGDLYESVTRADLR